MGEVLDEANAAYTEARRRLWASPRTRPRFTEDAVRVHAEDAEVRLEAEKRRLRALTRGKRRRPQRATTEGVGHDEEGDI